MSKAPKLSVVMSVYNDEHYLPTAIQSILDQSFRDFEFIIINDGSTDDSEKVIKSFKDHRIRYYKQANQGLAAALARGTKEARGEYIARMDADDISHHQRLSLQVAFLDSHAMVAVVGSSIEHIDQEGKSLRTAYSYAIDSDLRREAFIRNPLSHGSVTMRKEAIMQVGGYNPTEPIEDYELWARVLKQFQIAALVQPLYKWRINPGGMSHGDAAKRRMPIKVVRATIWKELEFPSLTIRQILRHKRRYNQLPLAAQIDLVHRYRLDQGRLGWQLLAHGRLVNASRAIAAFSLLSLAKYLYHPLKSKTETRHG